MAVFDYHLPFSGRLKLGESHVLQWGAYTFIVNETNHHQYNLDTVYQR